MCLSLVATSSHPVRDSNEQKIRHDNHVVHWSQHVDNDDGPLPAERNVHDGPRLPQYDFHSHIQYRVPHENVRPALPLLHGTMEPFRLSSCNPINTR